MNSNIPSVSMTPGMGRLGIWLPLFALLLSGNAWAARYQDIDLASCPSDTLENIVNLAGKVGTPAMSLTCDGLSSGCDIATANISGQVYWRFENDFGNNSLPGNSNCTGDQPNLKCAGIDLLLPAAVNVLAPATTKAQLSNSASLDVPATSYFYLTVTAEAGTPECKRHYRFKATSDGGGWGDPHITTVNGVNYDFQSAGEFVSLIGNDLEVQTRQTPIQTTSAPQWSNPYTGLRTCVSIYTAVAATVGWHTVSFQPGIDGEPSPEGLILYIDGEKTVLGPEGIHLGGEEDARAVRSGAARARRAARRAAMPRFMENISAHIFKTASGGIEIDYSTGTRLVASPAWWAGMQKWYLNVNVYDTTATKGVMGMTTNNWLPALRNGASLGAKPDSLHDRYVQLNKTFANSWRVGEGSLFVYAEGTSPDTFNYPDWPREDPKSCMLGEPGPGQPDPGPAVTPIDQAVAEQECAAVTDENLKANCIFDVAVTGHKGFAASYVAAQKEAPAATKTTVKAGSGTSGPGKTVTFTATVEREVPKPDGVPAGVVQFIIDGSNAGEPVKLDANGKAAYSTANLALGAHKVVAKFTYPGGFGEMLRGSTSAPVQHVVAETNWILWFIILIIILLIAYLLWRKYGKS